MTEIEQAYQRKVHSLTGSQRVLRSVALFEDVRRIIAHQISQTLPHARGRDLKIALAKRLYPSDMVIASLLRSTEE